MHWPDSDVALSSFKVTLLATTVRDGTTGGLVLCGIGRIPRLLRLSSGIWSAKLLQTVLEPPRRMRMRTESNCIATMSEHLGLRISPQSQPQVDKQVMVRSLFQRQPHNHLLVVVVHQ